MLVRVLAFRQWLTGTSVVVMLSPGLVPVTRIAANDAATDTPTHHLHLLDRSLVAKS